MSVFGGAEGDRTPGLRIANSKIRVLWTTKKHVDFAKNPNKNAAANKILATTKYDLQIPILRNFGNELATGKVMGKRIGLDVISFSNYCQRNRAAGRFFCLRRLNFSLLFSNRK